METEKITCVKLSDGNVYSFFDKGALRLNSDGVLVTGNTVIDNIIIDGHLSIVQVDEEDVDNYDYIVVQNKVTKQLAGRRKDTFLNTDLNVKYEEGGILKL